MELPGVRWDEPSILVAPLEGATALTQEQAPEETFLEAVHRAMRTIDLGSVALRCPALGLEFRETALRRVFRSPGLFDIKPIDGHEANALVLDRTSDEPISPPSFRGNFGEACQHIWSLPAETRAKGWVLSHDEIYTPAMLEMRRPSAPAPSRARRRIMGIKLPI